MIQTPHDRGTGVSPWIAGGGATVRGVPEKNAIEPFILGKDKNNSTIGLQGRKGTFVQMADGSVRFIDQNVSDDVFKAMCTIQGPAPEKFDPKSDPNTPLIPSPDAKEIKKPDAKPVDKTPDRTPDPKPADKTPDTKPVDKTPDTKPADKKPDIKPADKTPDAKAPDAKTPDAKPAGKTPDTKPADKAPDAKPTDKAPESTKSSIPPGAGRFDALAAWNDDWFGGAVAIKRRAV
jgi:hypothetical protein